MITSSNKKKLNRETSPLLIKQEKLDEDQIREMEKRNRILREKEKCLKKNGKFQIIKIESVSNDNDSEDEDIIRASSNHSRSITAGTATPKIL